MKAHQLAVSALAVLASAALAQNLKPGLWEVTNNMQTSSGQMEQSMAQMRKDMAAMPPEQRKMMEDMMARQGVKMGSGRPGAGASMKMCMTKEMVEKNELPAQQGDCRTTHQSRHGNTMKYGIACTNPPSTGEGQVVFKGPEAYSMKMVMNSTVNGKPEKMTMEGAGKWLGADCGSIKPIEPPKSGSRDPWSRTPPGQVRGRP